MGNSILAGLFVTGAETSGKIGFLGTDRRQDDGESFSGILEEKMQAAAYSGNRAKLPPRAVSHDKPAITAKKALSQGQKPDLKKSISSSKAGIDADQAVTPREEAPITGPEESEETKIRELADELVLLLEALFTQTETLIPMVEDASGEVAVEEAAVPGMSDPAETLKTMPDGSPDRLQDLLDRIRSAGQNAGQDESLALLDEIENLISEIRQNETGRASSEGPRLTAGMEKEGEALEDLISQLRNQCRELADKLRAGQENTAEQDPVPEANETRTAAPGQVPEETDADLGEGKSPEYSREPSSRAEKPAKEAQASSQGTGPENGRAAEITQTVEGHDHMPENPQAVHAGPPQTGLQDMKAEMTTFYLPDRQVSQTVTNQVTMKIKLMAGENKQELEMQLKPDSLGKLTLKIIHERGEVLARITAENEQVKSILENNMQLLKDALEKNGYSVQSLDVSVGDRNGGNQPDNQQAQNKRDRLKESGARLVGGAARPVQGDRRYGMDLPGLSQQIDLTA